MMNFRLKAEAKSIGPKAGSHNQARGFRLSRKKQQVLARGFRLQPEEPTRMAFTNFQR